MTGAEPVELRYHQRVAGSHRCKGWIEPWPLALGAAHAVIHVDAIRGDAEVKECLA